MLTAKMLNSGPLSTYVWPGRPQKGKAMKPDYTYTDTEDPTPILESFEYHIDQMRGSEVEDLFHELRHLLPPHLLQWAEWGWNR
jgi:hypothetical protein